MEESNIVLHVANETADIMAELSEQLFDETENRFKELIRNIENLNVDFLAVKQNEITNTELLQKLLKENETFIQDTQQRIEVITYNLKTLSSAIDFLKNQQNNLKQKQNELENDIEQLKLPFYKKWFAKR